MEAKLMRQKAIYILLALFILLAACGSSDNTPLIPLPQGVEVTGVLRNEPTLPKGSLSVMASDTLLNAVSASQPVALDTTLLNTGMVPLADLLYMVEVNYDIEPDTWTCHVRYEQVADPNYRSGYIVWEVNSEPLPACTGEEPDAEFCPNLNPSPWT